MRKRLGRFPAVIGCALTAFSLTGSTQIPANKNNSATRSFAAAQISQGLASGSVLYARGRYLEAREVYLSTASLAVGLGSPESAASAFNDAGGAALARQDFRNALSDFLKARDSARQSGQLRVLGITLNNLATLYLQMSNAQAARQMATEGLSGSAGMDAATRPKLRYQLASSLARLHRFDEALPIYRQSINELDQQGDFDSTARVLASLGSAALEANRLDEADAALTEALRLVRMHDLTAAGGILRGLARLRVRQGDSRSAMALFDAAITVPLGLTPRWLIYADRGEFRLTRKDYSGALDDFRAAERLISAMRLDIVPADQDRIALESGLSRVADGIVESGNRLAYETKNKSLLRETFDAAEQDRLWSLRALVPVPNDWRTRLPRRYWDVLARYRSVERIAAANPSRPGSDEAASLRLELQQIEATAGAASPSDSSRLTSQSKSPLAAAQAVLDADSVLLSFHLAETGGWVWAADRLRVDAYPLRPFPQIKSEIEAFSKALQSGDSAATGLGRRIYGQLFGTIPVSYLSRKRWLLELDGPLFDVPFAALSADSGQDGPVYLIERAAIEVIPGALMLQPVSALGTGEFLGVGDPVYNAADNRYRGNRNRAKDAQSGGALPRLPGTVAELNACARAWGGSQTRLLTGSDAALTSVNAAIKSGPSIIHFATHVITGPGEFSSGLIALSLDAGGTMGLLGPAEIVANGTSASLVVLNGCHSAQGETLPGTGLMGLTRSWIGAGATAVLATRWDIPDDAGTMLMAELYRSLRAHWDRGPAWALQQAELKTLRSGSAVNTPGLVGAYYLLGRT